MLNFEAFSLLFHVLEEYRQVGRDAIGAFKVFDVITCVKLLAQVLAHSLYIYDRLGELNVGFTGILEADWSKDFKLFILLP